MRVHDEAAAMKYNLLKRAVEDRISKALMSVEPLQLRSAMESNLHGGKLIRPMMTMLASVAAGGREHAALEAAAAIEMLHTSSLIHDDIMDDAGLRRGQPTTHVTHGVPMAILAGDTFIALAFELMHRISSPNKERINRVFVSSFRNVCEGQGFDLCLSANECTEQHAHTRMVEKKTAKLLEAAALIGGLCGTINEEHISALGAYGYYLGMAFQAKDDVLDATGSVAVMGKPVQADFRNGKRTFLTLAYAAQGSAEEVVGVKHAELLVHRFTAQACEALNVLPASEARNDLAELALALVSRRE